MDSTLMFRLTKLHLRSIKGKYVQFRKVTLPSGREQEVTVFSGNNALFLGQYTPLRTIAVHEAVFNDEKLLDYVITHEMAHKKQWWSLLVFPLALLAIAEAPGLFIRSIASIGETISTHNLECLWDFPLGMVAAALIAMPFAFSWIMELDADFQSIRTIGFKTFMELKNNELKPSKINLNFRVLINLITHPPTSATISIWRWLHKNTQG